MDRIKNEDERTEKRTEIERKSWREPNSRQNHLGTNYQIPVQIQGTPINYEFSFGMSGSFPGRCWDQKAPHARFVGAVHSVTSNNNANVVSSWLLWPDVRVKIYLSC